NDSANADRSERSSEQPIVRAYPEGDRSNVSRPFVPRRTGKRRTARGRPERSHQTVWVGRYERRRPVRRDRSRRVHDQIDANQPATNENRSLASTSDDTDERLTVTARRKTAER